MHAASRFAIATTLGLSAWHAIPAGAQDTAKVVIDTTTRLKSDSLPLVPTRRLAFSTTEATWASLDVSPDGRTIVFELLGDLYTLPIAGGQAKRVTAGPAFDSQPRWSPDGMHIVFISDRDGSENVWTTAPDGTRPRQISRATGGLFASPTWTPDGKYVVTSRQAEFLGSFQLWIYHKDGGTGVSLTKPDSGQNAVGTGRRPIMDAMGAAFGADSRYIWFARHRGGFGYNLSLPQWQLATFDRETGKIVVQSDDYGSSMRPVLSRDGKWLVYATRHDAETGLRLRELATGRERWLAWPVQRDDQESRFTRDLMPGSAFLPDGSALITSYGGKFWRVAIADGKATEIPFRADVEQYINQMTMFPTRIDTGDVLVRQMRNPATSPDGKRVVFSALDRLYTMDWPSGQPKRLTRDSVHEQVPAWSPDGRWIAYVTWTNDGGALWRTRADGTGKPQRLTDSLGFFDAPAWSPDGQRIVVMRMPLDVRFREREAVGVDLAWVPAAGGALTHIAFVNSGGRPHFTRDSTRLYVYDSRDGLVSMRFDGTDRRTHLKVTGYRPPGENATPTPADEIIVSPDGDRAAAQVDNRVWLVSLPRLGAQVPTFDVTLPTQTSFPVKKLTRIGGDFVGWGPNGRFVQWAIGRSLFRYDPAVGDSLDRLKTSSDSIRADSLERAQKQGAAPDSAAKARIDSIAKLPGYEGERVDVTIHVPRDVPRGTLVLRGARVVTMKGDEVIENGEVVIRDNRIVSVGPAGSDAPAGARVVNVTGKTIIPGLIDIHSHMWPVWGVHQVQVWKYLANLAYGVTTTRDPQTSTTDILTYADQVEAGAIIGPRIYSTGPGVFWSENFQSLDETRDALKRYSDFYNTKTIKQYLTGNRKQRQWVIMASKEVGLMPTTEGGLDFKTNLTEAIDGYPGHEHSYPITPLYKDAVELIAQSGITYTPTLLVNYGGPWAENYFYERFDIHDNPKVRRFFPHEEVDVRAERRPAWFRENQYVFDRQAKDAGTILRAGGRVGLGGHSQMEGLGVHWELQALASGGLTPHEVLRIGTINGAEAIGFGQDVGSLEPGKLADLIVLDKNPLENIRNTEAIQYVVKNGRLYDGNTLDEVYPRQRPLAKLRWADSEPARRSP